MFFFTERRLEDNLVVHTILLSNNSRCTAVHTKYNLLLKTDNTCDQPLMERVCGLNLILICPPCVLSACQLLVLVSALTRHLKVSVPCSTITSAGTPFYHNPPLISKAALADSDLYWCQCEPVYLQHAPSYHEVKYMQLSNKKLINSIMNIHYNYY